MTVVGFCEDEGISTASFYRWRKKLAARQTPSSGDKHLPAFQAVRVTAGDAAMAVLLPGGARVEVPAASLDAVRAVMGELLQYAVARDHGESTC
jgi:hypothetical protein